MIIFLKKINRLLKKINFFIIPYYFRERIDAEKFSIVSFMNFVSKKIRKGSIVLDAGAGSCPYKKYFSHTIYESTDFEDAFDKSSNSKHNFICSLEDIPKPDNYYDAIINTQVLEHVENPQKVINEFYRVLKFGGKLFLTAPQGWGVHGAPYHFFNFTNYGLESLFRNSGFNIVSIEPRGGFFWYLGKRIKTLPSYIFFQYFSREKEDLITKKDWIFSLILLPFYLASLPVFCFLIPLLFFYLDKLDKKKEYTLGYKCFCVK